MTKYCYINYYTRATVQSSIKFPTDEKCIETLENWEPTWLKMKGMNSQELIRRSAVLFSITENISFLKTKI